MPRRARGKARTLLVGVVGLIGLGLGLVPTEPAAAAGAANISFDVDGTLPTFPCTQAGGCTTDFDGTGTGGGEVALVISGVPHVATFTVLSGTVSGWATYSQPGFPACPLVGDAQNTMGRVTLNGGATGVIRRVQTGPALPGGTVTSVTFSVGINYTRAGGTAVIEVTGGSVTLDYYIPATGSGTITQAIVAGAGSGVFRVNAADSLARCTTAPGALDFELIGDASFGLN